MLTREHEIDRALKVTVPAEADRTEHTITDGRIRHGGDGMRSSEREADQAVPLRAHV